MRDLAASDSTKPAIATQWGTCAGTSASGRAPARRLTLAPEPELRVPPPLRKPHRAAHREEEREREDRLEAHKTMGRCAPYCTVDHGHHGGR